MGLLMNLYLCMFSGTLLKVYSLFEQTFQILSSPFISQCILKRQKQNKTEIQATEADVDLQSSFLVHYYSFVIMTEIKRSSIKQLVFIAHASLSKIIKSSFVTKPHLLQLLPIGLMGIPFTELHCRATQSTGLKPGKFQFLMFWEIILLYQTALQIKCLQKVIFVCQQTDVLTLQRLLV